MLTTQKTDAQKREEKRDNLIMQTASALNHLAVTMTAANQAFWAVDAEELVEDMNADFDRYESLLDFNTTLGLAVNVTLDELADNRYTKRVPLEIGNSEITLENGAFVYTPTPEPEELGE